MHDKVFAYIVQSQHNETLECHAFLCPKKKTASQDFVQMQSFTVTASGHLQSFPFSC